MRYLLLFLLFGCVFAQAQNEENWRVIPSVTEWLEEINDWPDSIYRQSNLHILFNYEKDKGLIATSNEEVENESNTQTPYFVNKRVRVDKLDFSGDRLGSNEGRWLTNVNFSAGVRIHRIEQGSFGFSNCIFGTETRFSELNGRRNLKFVNCQFNDKLEINNPIKPITVWLDHSIVKGDFMFTTSDEIPALRIHNSTLRSLYVQGPLRNLEMDSSKIELGVRIASTVNNNFTILDTQFPAIEIRGTNFSPMNTHLPFEGIKNRLSLDLGLGYGRIVENSQTYKASRSDELLDARRFDNLIASYYALLEVYKARGELHSYNACYIEMRDKQTARTKLLYEQDPDFNRYFDYQIARFTKVFSDYGTRPAKAIVIFFQVVLGFSVFYFFFPSSWNTTNSEKLMKRLSHLGGYFTSNEGLPDLFDKETKDRYMTYNEFNDYMDVRKTELPFYFQTLSKPLYRLTTARFNWTRGFLSRTDILNGKWAELPATRKTITSIVIGLYLLIYMIWVLIVRCLNAITLSLNAFSTLGFGEIPTRGIARYVTIIQGFVGWFLLSIFLVSLIGQILN